MAALHAAVTLVQVHHVTMRVCQYLHLRRASELCGSEMVKLGMHSCISRHDSSVHVRQGHLHVARVLDKSLSKHGTISAGIGTALSSSAADRNSD
jgi:hypothetical protein